MVMRVIIFLVTFLLFSDKKSEGVIFDFTTYGAIGDGITDTTKAFESAWKEACVAPTSSVVRVPKGTYNMNGVTLQGPCKAPLEIRVEGTLLAPKDPNSMPGNGGWLTMINLNDLTITGGGTLDGQGQIAWTRNDCHKVRKCTQPPINLRFYNVVNTYVHHITSKDSKNFHINVVDATNITFDHVTISTPGNSVNTDGIHVGRSKDIKILNSDIRAGDDCVSVGDGTQQMLIEGVNCGPGHGFAIGSLGSYIGEKNVVGIHFKNCRLTKTMMGVRIKTWPTPPKGYVPISVSDVSFEDITMDTVDFPVLIDQEYCPHYQCDKTQPSAVSIENVLFKNLSGTSNTPVTVQLTCSKGRPCQKIQLSDIDLKYNGARGGTVTSICTNVNPEMSGAQNPTLCTSSALPAMNM